MLKLCDNLGDVVNRPPKYDAWINRNAGDNFEDTVREYIAIVNDAAMSVDDGTRKRMEGHFVMSCKLKHLFWDQASNLMRWPECLG